MLEETTGEFFSPGYPDSYDHNQDCFFIVIVSDEAETIQVSVYRQFLSKSLSHLNVIFILYLGLIPAWNFILKYLERARQLSLCKGHLH